MIPESTVAKAIASIAQTGLQTASDVTSSNGRILRMIQAFAPMSVVSWVEGRRLRISQIKAQETVFEDICGSMVAKYKKEAKKLISSAEGLQDASTRALLADMEADLRLMDTIRIAVSLCPGSTNHNSVNDDQDSNSAKADVTWWDTMETLARRLNDPWRTELLAKAMVEYDSDPGCIRIKALWEIGMMESDDFYLLASFCDSSLYIDGKAMMLLEPNEQARFHFEDEDQLRVVNLSYAVSALVGMGLVDQSSVQFSTTDPVLLEHDSGPTRFTHHPKISRSGDTSIQIDAFSATNIAMDICRLYKPKFNVASDANFELFKELMRAESEEDSSNLGKVEFYAP